MEFRFRAGDRPAGRSPSFPARFSRTCDRRYSPRAEPFHGELPPPPPIEWEAAAWRERIIREEVERRLICEEVQRRLICEALLIEQEVRRELAVARARLGGAFGPVPFVGSDGPFVPPPVGAFFGPYGPFLAPVPLPLMPVGMQLPLHCPPPASFGEREREREGFDGRVGLEQSILVKRRTLPPPKLKPKHKLIKVCETEPSKNSEIILPETKVSGVKRKADVISASTEPTELQNGIFATTEPAELQNGVSATTEPAELQNGISAITKPAELQNGISATTEPAELQNAARHWNCALCQVSATSWTNLNKHRRGRRHLAKLVQSRGIQVICDNKSDKGAVPSDAPKKIRILVKGAIHEVVQKSDFLTFATTKPTEQQNAISGTAETAELQNMTSATTEPTELQNAARDWSCAVCQVSTANKAKRKKHLKGKKHLKRKLALYGASIAASVAGPNDPLKKIHILVDQEMHEVVQQGNYVWCERCSVRCTNAATMADHLRGKKHSLLNKAWRSIMAVRMKNKIKEDSAARKEGKVNDNGQ